MEANTSALEKMSVSPSFVDDDALSEASSQDDGGVLLDSLDSCSDDEFDDSELDDDAIWDVALAAGSRTSASSVASNPQVPTTLPKSFDVQFCPEKPAYGLIMAQKDESMLFGVWFIDCVFSDHEPTQFVDCRLEDAVFEGCRFGASKFTGVVMKGTRFEDCIFEDTWWANVELPEGEIVQDRMYLGERQLSEEVPGGLTDEAHIALQERRLAGKDEPTEFTWVGEPSKEEKKEEKNEKKKEKKKKAKSWGYRDTEGYKQWVKSTNLALSGTGEDFKPKA